MESNNAELTSFDHTTYSLDYLTIPLSQPIGNQTTVVVDLYGSTAPKKPIRFYESEE